MTKEFLPIRQFAQREIDEQRVEGGGSADRPAWVLVGDELSSRSAWLQRGFEGALHAKGHNPYLPYAFNIRLDERDTAKSKRRVVADMFCLNANQPSNFVGMVGSSSIVMRLPDLASAEEIKSRLQDCERYEEAISCVLDITRFQPAVEEAGEDGCYKVRLFNDSLGKQRGSELFEEELASLGVEYQEALYTADTQYYKIWASEDQLRAILDSTVAETVFSIKPMPKLNVVLDGIQSSDAPQVETPDPDADYPLLGILDSGIEPISHLSPWGYDKRYSPYPECDIDTGHGTFVAGVALYGDSLEHRKWVGGKTPKVFDATIVPDLFRMDCDEDELIENIRSAVALKTDEVKVWNLSVSINKDVSPDEFSDFAMALDEIQDEYGVLICKSAGNCTDFVHGNGKSPLSAGADSVRALTVGSTCHKQGPNDLAAPGDASPFSRRGPGPEYIIKPEVSHYGGNAGLDAGVVCQTGVASFAPDGSSVSSVGTSFSTPRVAALASNLEFAIDGEFDPLLTKALIIHSASFPGDDLIPNDEKVNEMGFGIPSDVGSILSDNPYESTLVLRGTLARREIIDILDFPMPRGLVREGRYSGQIVLTLASSPVLDPTQGGEYCQSDIDVKFGSYDELSKRDTTRPTILNPIGRSGATNLLLPSKYSKRKMDGASEDFAQRERMLIQYGGKYYPVKKYAIDLDELTNANLAAVDQDKHWFLYLKGTYRDATERASKLTGEILEQEFCLMVTVRDPEREADVYNEVAQFLDAHGFWHESVKVNNEVKARVGM